jgi:hypothetical protein
VDYDLRCHLDTLGIVETKRQFVSHIVICYANMYAKSLYKELK